MRGLVLYYPKYRMASKGLLPLTLAVSKPVSPSTHLTKVNYWVSFLQLTCTNFSSLEENFLYEPITLHFLGLKLRRIPRVSL